MEQFTINAVYEDDLEKVMKSCGLWDLYKSGKLKCVCGVAITEDNLTAFKKVKGKVHALHSLPCEDSLTNI